MERMRIIIDIIDKDEDNIGVYETLAWEKIAIKVRI